MAPLSVSKRGLSNSLLAPGPGGSDRGGPVRGAETESVSAQRRANTLNTEISDCKDEMPIDFKIKARQRKNKVSPSPH